MKIKFIPISFLLLFSFCKPKVEIKKNANIANTLSQEENFNEFYKKFSENETFCLQRTKIPFPYLNVERDEDSGENVTTRQEINSFPVKLDKKKWKEKVSFSIKPINSDSVKLIISIEDTGYHLEILFIRNTENRRWYAIQAENSST